MHALFEVRCVHFGVGCVHFLGVLYLFSRVVCLFYGVYFHSNSEEKVERRLGDG